MNRKKFIEKYGATCDNWRWSWSFVNHDAKVVIFGAWDVNDSAGRQLIFAETWKITRKHRKSPAYDQSREHIRLIEEEGYALKTFRMKQSRASDDQDAPAKIDDFTKELETKTLQPDKDKWYAV